MKQSTAESYRQRVIRVVEYIHDHLDEDLSLHRLADVAYMSPYHFHRIYRELADPECDDQTSTPPASGC
jgi:AraC family transcriptional regulator